MTEKITFERSVNSLVDDSLRLLYMSKDSRDHDDSQLFARSSGIYTMLLLESIANICIEHIEFERSVYKEVDRLPIIAKFDFYLRIKMGKEGLPRGDSDVQSMQEVKTLRDGMVHPKVQKFVWTVHDEETQSMTSEAELTAHLKVAKDLRFWEFEQSLEIMKAVHGFLNHFFLQRCGYSPKESSALLLSEEKVPSTGDDLGPTMRLLECRDELENWGVKLEYLCGDHAIA